MKVAVVGGVFGALICATALWAADAPAKKPQEVADTREATMKRLGGHLKAAFDPAATPEVVRKNVGDALKIAEAIPSLFPKGTGIGDPGITHSRALQDIWAKPAEFKAAADGVVKALQTADAAAASGDKTQIGAALRGVGGACKTCHDAFRGPEID